MTQQQKFQEEEYDFPYHHLPSLGNNYWELGKWYFDGLEYLAILTHVKNLINESKPNNILDFGCGDGRLSLELQKEGFLNIVGMDISEKALNYAKVFNKGINGNIKFVSSFDKIENNKFDLIVAMEVLEHIHENELPEIIKKLFLILEDNGKFIVTVPHLNKKPIPMKHFRHYDLELIRNHVSEYFNIDDAQYLIKLGFIKKMIRQVMINRFFILNWKPLTRLTKIIYERFVLKATKRSGSNLVVILSKKK